MNPKSIKKILVIQQKMIGDVLISSVLCSHLKTIHSQAEIHYAIHEGTQPVVAGHPDIDQFILSTPKMSWNQWRKFIGQIRRANYDLIIDAYGKIESLFIILGAQAPMVHGHKKWFSKVVYTQISTPNSRVYTLAGNALEDRLRLIYQESEIAQKALKFKPKIHLTDQEIKWAKDLLKKNKLNKDINLVMVSVLGSSAEKSLPQSTMAQILEVLAQQPKTHILLNYIPSQLDEVQDILSILPTQYHSQLHQEIYGRNLREFLALLSQVDYLVGNEGGAVNMAKALDIPTFTLFSPWINKSAWNNYADQYTHMGLHLKDYRPELFKGRSNKEIRQDYQRYYQSFKFDLFSATLNSFCQKHSHY